MFNKITISEFPAIPHLNQCALVSSFEGTISLSGDKPNVVVGPNGAGKSSLLQALAMYSLSAFTGQSAIDSRYASRNDAFWLHAREGWERYWKFMPGLHIEGDRGICAYYRPRHIPGGEDSIASAMMTGYFEEARAYGRLTENKSSGQQNRARLQAIMGYISGELAIPDKVGFANWGHRPTSPAEYPEDRYGRAPYREKERAVLEHAERLSQPGKAVVLLDEPEQSLDARSEVEFWHLLKSHRCSNVQVILASHSFFPLLYPESFNLIEATPGYIKEVQALLHTSTSHTMISA